MRSYRHCLHWEQLCSLIVFQGQNDVVFCVFCYDVVNIGTRHFYQVSHVSHKIQNLFLSCHEECKISPYLNNTSNLAMVM